jgi:galactokinase
MLRPGGAYVGGSGGRRILMNKTLELIARFQALFGTPSICYRAPGRVNLIGEHTDYNAGFVLPASIGFSCWVAEGPRDDDKLVIHSENFNETVEARLDGNHLHRERKWSDYALGIAWMLQKSGYALRGANLYVRGEIPLGAGLSSSAAIEVAVACALLDRAGYQVDRTEIAKLSQRAENEFVGAHVGIMDQFVCCNGRAGHVLLLDCRSLEHWLVPFPREIRLVVCNTMVKHEHGEGEYNLRRSECEEGVRKLSSALPGIEALRDVTITDLERNRGFVSETIYRRCRHVITENERVPRAAAALKAGDVGLLGELMAESHRSLRDDYEVSCPELDLMVELAKKQKGVHGARMTGGGFGGCTVNLVDRGAAAEFKRAVAAEYREATGRHPDIFVSDTSQGVERVPLDSTEPAARELPT